MGFGKRNWLHRDVEDAVPYAPCFDDASVGVGLLDDPMGSTVRKMGFGKRNCLHRDVEDAIPYAPRFDGAFVGAGTVRPPYGGDWNMR